MFGVQVRGAAAVTDEEWHHCGGGHLFQEQVTGDS